jgi:hypothetical protein
MKKIIIIFLSYILFFFNTNLFSNDDNSEFKIGLLAPFSGEYKSLGNSLLLSTQLALDELNDPRIKIIPRDTGSNNKEKLNIAIQEIIDSGAKIIIGPADAENFEELYKYKDIIFISLSNKNPKIYQNVISIGISLESQIKSLVNFINKQNKTKTVIIFPKNQYSKLIEKKLKNIKLKNYKIFKYNSDPKVLTGEIEKLTNYSQRKRNLEFRKKLLEGKDDERSKKELQRLEQKYTLGEVNFDSIIIIDFGNSLKSVIASLVFSEVNDELVLYTTVNQWFDESIFYENSVNTLYYPSVNYKNFKKYNKKYLDEFNLEPNEITILAYDALGLIYYIWKKQGKIDSVNDFLIKDKIKGKIGTFSFENGNVNQELKIYKTHNNKITEY